MMMQIPPQFQQAYQQMTPEFQQAFQMQLQLQQMALQSGMDPAMIQTMMPLPMMNQMPAAGFQQQPIQQQQQPQQSFQQPPPQQQQQQFTPEPVSDGGPTIPPGTPSKQEIEAKLAARPNWKEEKVLVIIFVFPL